jgi:hypothetical protein
MKTDSWNNDKDSWSFNKRTINYTTEHCQQEQCWNRGEGQLYAPFANVQGTYELNALIVQMKDDTLATETKPDSLLDEQTITVFETSNQTVNNDSPNINQRHSLAAQTGILCDVSTVMNWDTMQTTAQQDKTSPSLNQFAIKP